ncbi:MAG TPA: TetR/AcrR family transcriptional regulator [Alphaproteobacteria bacterium]|nr:TetR/AcrR family transcriptional regulator [Alphaproteobacteria bacterium]
MSRRTYHHGDLRETLVRAALDLIREKGHAGFTFADAARLAGVSPAAPYRHFRDRDELMADIARRGFELFEAALAKAWNHGQPDPLRALQRMGAAYLDFARTEASYYATMFEAGIPAAAHPALGQAGERAFGVLLMAAESLTPLLPAQGRPPARMIALHIWALSHGVAALFGRGDEGRRALPMPAQDLLEAGVLVYLRGLGLFEPKKPSN